MTLRAAHPDIAPEWFADFERVLASGRPERLNRKHATQPLLYEVALYPATGGERPAVVVRLRDITGEQQEREQRRKADERYKRLFDAIDEGFCIIEVIFDNEGRGIDYRFLEANDAFVEHTGLENSVGKTVRELQPDIEDKWAATYGRIAQSGVAERFENDSSAMGRWFDVFAFPIGDAAPYLVGILFEDIGARKAMELALRHSENRLKSLIEATSDLIFRMNPECTLMEQVGGKPLLGDLGEPHDWIGPMSPPRTARWSRRWSTRRSGSAGRSSSNTASVSPTARSAGCTRARCRCWATTARSANGSARPPTSPIAAMPNSSSPTERRC